MKNENKRKLVSLALASTMIFNASTLTGCSNNSNNENESDIETVISESIEKAAKEHLKTDNSLSDASAEQNITQNPEATEEEKTTEGSKEQEKENEVNSEPSSEETTDDGLEEDKNALDFLVQSKAEYKRDDLYVINGEFLEEGLGSYITTSEIMTEEEGNIHNVYVSYPSVNGDFVLVHKITFIDGKLESTKFYSNLSNGISTSSNEMNTVLSNTLINPITDRIIIENETLTLEEVNEYLSMLRGAKLLKK